MRVGVISVGGVDWGMELARDCVLVEGVGVCGGADADEVLHHEYARWGGGGG